MNWAIIDDLTNIVINMIVWDGVTPWEPPAGTYAIQTDIAGIGWIYDPLTQTFFDPNGE